MAISPPPAPAAGPASLSALRAEGLTKVYAVVAGRAEVRPVAIDRRNQVDASVSQALAIGETVILYPSDRVKPGARVTRARRR